MTWRLPAILGCALLGCAPADECPRPATRCDGNVAELCATHWVDELNAYYDLTRRDCGEKFCREPKSNIGAAYCALDPEDDPRCPEPLRAAERAGGCVDGKLTTWSYGARIGLKECPEGTTCLALNGACRGEAYCAPRTTPDPLCAGPITTCADEATIVWCRCGFNVDAHACRRPGPRCVIERGLGVCRP